MANIVADSPRGRGLAMIGQIMINLQGPGKRVSI
ncbi:hypothetical protein QFZ23_004765 [Arthrobacter globiformis]|nr:hypothetical protein [Arthrobacter globiformis]